MIAICMPILCIRIGNLGFPGGSVVKNLLSKAGDARGFDPWVRKIPWRRKC